MIVLATILLAAVGLFSYRTELVTLRATSVDAGNEFGGAGVNLEAVPNVNLISDPSFEMSSDYLTFVVATVDSGAIYLEPKISRSRASRVRRWRATSLGSCRSMRTVR